MRHAFALLLVALVLFGGLAYGHPKEHPAPADPPAGPAWNGPEVEEPPSPRPTTAPKP